MKIHMIEENSACKNLTNSDPLFLLSNDGTYILNISFHEIKDILIGEGYDAPARLAAPQRVLMRGLIESMRKKWK